MQPHIFISAFQTTSLSKVHLHHVSTDVSSVETAPVLCIVIYFLHKLNSFPPLVYIVTRMCLAIVTGGNARTLTGSFVEERGAHQEQVQVRDDSQRWRGPLQLLSVWVCGKDKEE